MNRPKVLLVEDDPDDVLFMKRAFSHVCPTVALEVAHDGQEAVDHLAGRDPAERPTHVLLDLKLPKKPGLEVLQWIRSSPEVDNLRVMILSSSQIQAEVDRAKHLGIDAYLVKPVGFATLLDLVRKICRDWELAQTNGGSCEEPDRGSP